MKRMIVLGIMFLLAAGFPAGSIAASGSELPEAGKIFLRIDENAVVSGMDRSYLQGYSPSVSYDRLSLIIPLAEVCEIEALSAKLIIKNEYNSPLKNSSTEGNCRYIQEKLWAAVFGIPLFPDRINGDYPCTLSLSGKTAGGEEFLEDLTLIIRIRDGRAGTDALRLGLSDAGSELKVGEEGVIRLNITNESYAAVPENLILTINEAEGAVLPQGSGRIRPGEILPGETLEVSLPVTVLPAASVAPHVFTVKFEGISVGQSFFAEESIVIPVTQEMRLEQGGVSMAGSVIEGDSVSVSVILMNKGKADIINASVTANIPGVVEHQSVLAGTIAPGESKTAQLSFISPLEATGDYTGTLVIEGEDNSGNRTSFDLPLNLTIEKAPAASAPEEVSLQKVKTPAAVYILAGACALLLALLIITFSVMKGKLNRLEEERL